MGENLTATKWGWGIKNEQMEPTKTDLGCASSELLSLMLFKLTWSSNPMISVCTATLLNDLYSPGAIMRRKRTPTKFFMMKLLNYFDTYGDIPNSVVKI